MIEAIIGALVGNVLFVLLALFVLGFSAYSSTRDETPWYMFVLIALGFLVIPKVIVGYNLLAFGVTIPGWKAAIVYFTTAAIVAVIQMRVYDIDTITTKAATKFGRNVKELDFGFSYRWVTVSNSGQMGEHAAPDSGINIRIWWFGVLGYFIQYMILAPVLVIDWFIGDVVKKVFIRIAQHLREVLIAKITKTIAVKMQSK